MTAPTEDAIRIYTPEIDPNNYEVYAADDTHAAIFEKSGWLRAPEPAPAREGYAQEPVRYEQDDDGKWHPMAPELAPEPEPPKTVRRTNKPAEDT